MEEDGDVEDVQVRDHLNLGRFRAVVEESGVSITQNQESCMTYYVCYGVKAGGVERRGRRPGVT